MTTILTGAEVGPCGDPGDSKWLVVGIIVDHCGASAPAGWLECFGQAVSRIGYAGLYSVIGTTWGAGDGSSTFNVPDLRGRVCAGLDNMGGTSADRITQINGDLLGAAGGAQSHAVTIAEMASHSHSDSQILNTTGNYWTLLPGATVQQWNWGSGFRGNNEFHNNTQPTAVARKIIFTGV